MKKKSNKNNKNRQNNNTKKNIREDRRPREEKRVREDRRPREDRKLVDNRENFIENENVVEGRNPVIETIKSGREIEHILIADGSKEGSINKIKGMAAEKNIIVKYVPKSKLDAMSQTGSHQGVIALVSAYEYKTVEDILNVAKRKGEEPFVIILDEIEDPHNLGSIMRTAECAGAHGVIIPKRRSASVTATAIKTSAGASEHMPVAKVTNLSQTIDELKEKGLWIYGADMRGESYHYDTEMKGSIGIIIGSEGKGMSRIIKEKCDVLVKIPMKGKVTSLNASVAASLMIYEVVRQKDLSERNAKG